MEDVISFLLAPHEVSVGECSRGPDLKGEVPLVY